MSNTIFVIENMLGKKRDFRICENCGHLTDTSQMVFNFFGKEHWFFVSCVEKLKSMK